uniref:Uncharacterized protein n=1 Tax=Rhizophora mucronata TaxID=61149 RepID=A0A2P2Q9N4_RHIMU
MFSFSFLVLGIY